MDKRQSPTWMLYGANGYTGALIAEAAAARGLRPILAGRREGPVRELAGRLGLEHRVFPLADPATVADALTSAGVGALVLAAGPFSQTSAIAAEACLRAGVHYLDITGEIAVFEALQARDREARERGVILLPGVGFDVVPTDCLARALADRLPEATSLELAFYSRGGMSRGTLKTTLESMTSSMVRRGGALEAIAPGSLTATIPFADRPREAAAIPWGDLSTAHWSTRIPDITVYMAMPPRMIRGMRALRLAAPALRSRRLVGLLQRLVGRFVEGPDADTRRSGHCLLWGRARDPHGREVVGTLRTPEGYSLTVDATIAATLRVLAGEVAPGYQTPSTAFSAGFVSTLPGCEMSLGT
ncbi:MAG: saccharopine dehydrogenase NADP-binding domain-containing protein [Myxococcales bacterium]|nr:saccharopine dehydrogenase NADP-binding domain-containing protein [Myxococcales bacterium]